MRVGTSKLRQSFVYTDKDHPHACGDKLSSYRALSPSSGSSPCVWGQETGTLSPLLRTGIIPMRVGTRTYLCRKADINKDHPHACGDKLLQTPSRTPHQGSSPCVWGQVYDRSGYSSVNRIIPMRVGTRQRFCVVLNKIKDHPHACGDKRKKLLRKNTLIGSSPCVWGQVFSTYKK